ncbi:glycosyltransferase [Lyngbya aestuarii]|uniref:glycosyltransferase n=1 Tax=Lyngbya aestuarii TaxID=118322 RepID=UPI00403DEC0E
MKTIQSVARYFPDNCGGIQTHLSELLPVLLAQGIECQVAASQDSPEEKTYNYGGVEVYRYPVFPKPQPEPNHGEAPHGGFEHFARWLKEQKADIYHQHQWTPKCGLPHLRLAKELGMATVVSVRLPHPICQRGSLMLNGQEACDGKIDEVRCSQCCGVSQNLSPSAIQSLSNMPMPISVLAGRVLNRLERTTNDSLSSIAGELLSPLALPAYVAARRRGLLEMAKFADRIVVMSEWVKEAMLINGIPQEKFFLLKHGISDFLHQRVSQPKKTTGLLRVGFLGRWNSTKGVNILVEAVKSLPQDVPLELIIHGIPEESKRYQEQVIARIGNDHRIHLAPQLKRQEVSAALSTFDVLAVPSQWLETGPVVVLEAHAQGVPVIGSNLGGIAEKVKHGVDGLLISPGDPTAWAEAFSQLALDANLLNKLRQGIQPVRTISMEAADSIALYESLLQKKLVSGSSELLPA